MTLANKIVRDADLPSPSPILARFFGMMFDPKCSLDELAQTIATDAGLSARTLRAANAAYSSPEHRIDDIRDAVVRIGLASTIHIAAASEIKAVFFSVSGRFGDMKRLWTHNLATACLADAYARHHRLERPARWFTGGLLHDIGRLALLKHDPIKYAEVVKLRDYGKLSICAAEQDVYGLSHEMAGYELMRLWRFPEEICGAAFHHDLTPDSHSDLSIGVSIANDLANALEGDKPLPRYESFSAEQVIAQASDKYEIMKQVSGFD